MPEHSSMGGAGLFCSGDAFVRALLRVVPGSSLLQSDDTRITGSDERMSTHTLDRVLKSSTDLHDGAPRRGEVRFLVAFFTGWI